MVVLVVVLVVLVVLVVVVSVVVRIVGADELQLGRGLMPVLFGMSLGTTFLHIDVIGSPGQLILRWWRVRWFGLIGHGFNACA